MRTCQLGRLIPLRKCEGMSAGGSLERDLFLSDTQTHMKTKRERGMESCFGLLFFLVALHSANCLKCYVCSSTASYEYCNRNSEECQAPLDTCMTTVDISGDVKAIVKQCSSSKICAGAAASVTLDSNGDGSMVTCCSSRLCNFSAAPTIQMSTWLLTLPVCVLMFLIKVNA